MPMWRRGLHGQALRPVVAPPAQEAPSIRCLNCGCVLTQPRPKFCGACGQETNLRPPRFVEFVQQLGGAYFSTEGALWRTLALLLFWPGELTRRYLAGRRKHYVLPLRLYITLSLLALVLLRLQTPSDLQLNGAVAAEAADKRNITVLGLGDTARAGLKDGVFFCNDLPKWVCKRLESRLDLDPKSFARELARVPERFLSHSGTAMFLLVPFFALLHKLLYWRVGMRYSEHLVHALHVHSLWFAALALALLPWSAVAALLAIAVPVYTLLAAKRVYGGGWWATLLKAGVVGLCYSIVLGVTLGLVGLYAFFS